MKKIAFFGLFLLFSSEASALLLQNSTPYNIVVIKKTDIIFDQHNIEALDIKTGAKTEKIIPYLSKNVIPETHYCVFCDDNLYYTYFRKIGLPYIMYLLTQKGLDLYWESYLPLPIFPLSGKKHHLDRIECSAQLLKKLNHISEITKELQNE